MPAKRLLSYGSTEDVPNSDATTPGLPPPSALPRISKNSNQQTRSSQQPDEGKSNAAHGAAGAVAVNMFADADAIRAKMHENIDKKDYDVMDFYHERGCFQAIARNNKFGNLTLAVIAINALWIGLDAECNDATYDGELTGCPFKPEDKKFWQLGEYTFCAFFTFEWLVRFMAFKQKMSAMRDNWFKFDSALVFMMVAETWMIPIIAGGNSDAMADFALLRMMRLLRLTRMVRLMRSVPELLTLLKGMGIAARSVAYTLLLLLIIMYIFGIIFKSQLEETQNPELQKDFGGIPRSMWTLLFAGCLVDDITLSAERLMKESFMMAAIFILFVLLSSLMVLNMLIGVLCAVVTAVAAAEKEKVLINYVKTRLIDVLQTLDEDGNGTISRKEFDQLLTIPEAYHALSDLGVDVHNLLSLGDHLFDADDNSSGEQTQRMRTQVTGQASEAAGDEEEERSMTFADFLEMVIRLRSDNAPSVADIVDLRKLIFKGQRQAMRRLHHIEKGQLELQRGIRTICEQLDQQWQYHGVRAGYSISEPIDR